jgi:hypothetical protein
MPKSTKQKSKQPRKPNPICPLCAANGITRHTTKHSTQPNGKQRYRCRAEGCNYTCTEGGLPRGEQMIGEAPMTQAERDRRYKAKRPPGRNNPKKVWQIFFVHRGEVVALDMMLRSVALRSWEIVLRVNSEDWRGWIEFKGVRYAESRAETADRAAVIELQE